MARYEAGCRIGERQRRANVTELCSEIKAAGRGKDAEQQQGEERIGGKDVRLGAQRQGRKKSRRVRER